MTTPQISPDVIEIDSLVKTFKHARALDGVDLRVRAGEVHGFLGPNGAGKSTTIRVLLGLARADTGRVRLLGGDPWRDAVALHRRIAYVPGDVNLWPHLTGGEAIDLFTGLRGGIDPARRAELVARFELDEKKKGRSYSKGNRQKVALVAALACDAELLILDEPTSGLDPLMESVFQDCIRQERRRGRSVLLSSHLLTEVESLCDRVSIIRAGRVIESGSMADLRHLTRTTITAELVATDDTPWPASHPGADGQSSADRAAAGPPAAHDLVRDGRRIHFDVEATDLTAALAWLANRGVTSLHAAPPTLQEVFLRHYALSPPAAPGGPNSVQDNANDSGGSTRKSRPTPVHRTWRRTP